MTTLVRQNVYAAWLDGDVTAMEALRSLCADYEEVEQSYKDFEGIRDGLREQISTVLAKVGDRVDVKGFGVLMLTAPSITEGFDKKALTALVNDLVQEGNAEVAQRIMECRTRSARAGGLRIERQR